MATAQLIREARRGRGLTQRALADRLKLGQSALADIERSAHDTRGDQLDRIVNAAGYRLAVLPTHAHSAADWADLIYEELRGPRRSESVAFRALIGLNDDLAGVSKPLRVALCVAPPAPCGDPRFDAALAALVEHHLTISRLPVPDWVREPSRFLSEPWVVSPYTDTDTEDVPKAFRRHGVLLGVDELRSV
jgi:transcriptional regulator with XRE-family HTH domain